MIIQKYLIQYILSPLGGVMEKLSEKLRNVIFVLAGLGVVLHLFMDNMSMIKYRFLIFFAIDCLFFGVMILCTVSKDMKPVKFRWPLAVCWFGVGILMFVSGILNNMDYLPEAILFLTAYPVLFICWNNCSRTRIFKLLLWISKISVAVFFVLSLLFAKIVSQRYPGIFNNTNGAAFFLAVGVVCLLIEIMYVKKLNVLTVLDMILLGIGCAMLYYTNSRTGFLALILAAFGGVVMYLMAHDWKENVKFLLRMGVTVVIAVLLVNNLVYLFQVRTKLNLPYFDSMKGIFITPAPAPGNPPAAPDAPQDQKYFDISGFRTVMDEKGDSQNKTLDQYSTGRISIWKAYAKDLNWTGHESTPLVYIEAVSKNIGSTHMTILQIAYESGIPAGILYLLLNLGTGFVSIWFAWKNRKERYAVMPLMITLVFGAMSMLSSCGVSLWYMTTLYYYWVQFPILADMPEERKAVLPVEQCG